jgi:hypothetical protein
MAVSAKAVNVTAELWRLVETGNLEALARLLPRVADVNACNRHGMTLLMKAACCGHARIVRLLLEHGADPNLIRNDKFTALALAAFFGHSETVRTLLEFGAQPETVTRSGASARTWATARTFAEVARCLDTPPSETQPRATVQLKRSASSKRIVALGICATFFLIVCCGLGALVLRSSEARNLAPEPLKPPVRTVESRVVDPPPVQPVVTEPIVVEPIKTETRTRPPVKKSGPREREPKPVPVLSVAPVEQVQITKPPAATAPKSASPRPTALSPQLIAPTKKARVIQWP